MIVIVRFQFNGSNSFVILVLVRNQNRLFVIAFVVSRFYRDNERRIKMFPLHQAIKFILSFFHMTEFTFQCCKNQLSRHGPVHGFRKFSLDKLFLRIMRPNHWHIAHLDSLLTFQKLLAEGTFSTTHRSSSSELRIQTELSLSILLSPTFCDVT